MINFFEKLVADKSLFIKEYENLFPQKSRGGREDVLFTHNDIQENNILAWNNDKTKLTLIDFEYSSLNFRGYDIAAYMNETMIDYT